MTFLVKHIRSSVLTAYIAVALMISACAEEKVSEQVVARVGDALLFEKDVDLALDSLAGNKLYRQEYIRRWVEDELLYQEAINRQITGQRNYKNQLHNSKTKLAAGILLESILADKDIEISDSEIKDYFNKHKSEFQVQSGAYVLNVACFSSRDVAEKYRVKLLTSEWSKVFSNVEKQDFISNETSKFVYDYEIDNSRVKRILPLLKPNDISLVISDGENRFCIYSVVRKYGVDDIPVFDDVKTAVRNRLIMIKQKKLYKDIINNLYSKYEVKIY